MHILLIDDRVPDPHFGAGFPRAYRLLMSLVKLGHKITFFPTLKQTLSEVNHEMLKSYNIFVTDDLKKVDKTVDVAILSRPHNMHYFLPVVRETQPQAKVVYDTEALWYRRYDLQLAITGRLPGWAYRYDELGLARSVDLCYVVNSVEKQILEENGVKTVRVLAHALDVHPDGKPFEGRKDVLVVGGILEEDSSNEDALWTYLTNAWGQVRTQTGALLKVTGHASAKRLVEGKFDGMHLLGHVPDLVPLYEEHRIFVAMTRFATGIPWKVHEAMAHGIPCVISGLLAEQLGVTDCREALVAKSPEEMIAKSVLLYQNKGLWESVRSAAYDLIRRDCDQDKFCGVIATSLAALR